MTTEARLRLSPASGLGLGVAMLWFSILVLLPLSAVVITATEGGWDNFVQAVTNEQTRAAVRLTVTQAAVAQLSVPVIAALGAALTLGETLTARLALSGLAVLTGVGVVLAARTRGAP